MQQEVFVSVNAAKVAEVEVKDERVYRQSVAQQK